MKNATKKQDNLFFKVDKKGRHVSGFLVFLKILLLPLIHIFFPFRVYGQKKIPDGPCVYFGNHYRVFDIAYPTTTTKESMHFVSKFENANKPVLGFACRKMKTIYVNRDGKDVRATLDCMKCLNYGEKLVIFPEGTRNKTNAEFLPFKPGAGVFSVKTKTPMVPMLVYKKQRLFRLTHVIIGEPFEFTEYYDKALTEEDKKAIDDILLQKLKDLKAEHTKYLESKRNKKKK